VPVDPTVAISDEKRSATKTYSATNLNPMRLVIQKNIDTPMDPPLPDDVVVFGIVRQTPAIVSPTADNDLDYIGTKCFSIDLRAVGP